MNNETALIIAMATAVMLIFLVFGFSQGILNSAKESIIGGDDGDGIAGCNPAEEGENGCPENTELELEEQEEMVKV